MSKSYTADFDDVVGKVVIYERDWEGVGRPDYTVVARFNDVEAVQFEKEFKDATLTAVQYSDSEKKRLLMDKQSKLYQLKQEIEQLEKDIRNG
jgi:hypothetical protein